MLCPISKVRARRHIEGSADHAVSTTQARAEASRVDEAVSLAGAIALDVIDARVVNLTEEIPATLFGAGTVESVAGEVEGTELQLVIVDGQLSPVQQRNLERAWRCKVIDRTGLILEIFGARAQTAEGKLQVELAALGYQRSRLVRSWTHLERQRGGLGFVGGPGESQIELDRRLIDGRIDRIKRDLEQVKRTRGLHREARAKVPYPTVAMVGYTNAGKSTLFNRIAGADVFAKDLLFATLDPTMRGVTLASGIRVILSDTVGFVSDLPTHLVAAFRATLEEVVNADIVLHVRDRAHPDTSAQCADVLSVITDLGLIADDERVIEVFNKADQLAPDDIEGAQEEAAERGAVLISAITGEGLEALAARIDAHIRRHDVRVIVGIPVADGAAQAWLHRHGDVQAAWLDDDEQIMDVSLSGVDYNRFVKHFPTARQLPPSVADPAPGDSEA